MRLFGLPALLVAVSVVGCLPESDDLQQPTLAAALLTVQRSGLTERLQAVDAVDRDVVWASGVGGVVTHSTDGGLTWDSRTVPGAEELQFRDIHAVSDRVAYLLAAGPGDRSRILVTGDGGETWRETWRNEEPEAFYDCFDFWNRDSGIAFGDAIAGSLRMVWTYDGESWQKIDLDQLPPALAGEGGFAASGGCVVTYPPASVWIGTGAGGEARVLTSDDGGSTWSAVATPIYAGTPTAGITTLVRVDDQTGLAFGGDVANTELSRQRVAITVDGGQSWSPGGALVLQGAVYGAALAPDLDGPVVVAVGPGGADLSRDGGRSWEHLSDQALWSIAFAGEGIGWGVGPEGTIVRFEISGSGGSSK